MARPEKEAAVREIAQRFADVEAALLTEYRGLRVGEIAEVRGALRQVDAEYKVVKNTLARIAVREVGLEELVAMLEGPTAVAFCAGDAAAAAKALDDAAKKYPVLVLKGGVLNGQVISGDQAQQLARLEPLEVQLAKIARLFNAPAQNAVNVLAALLRDLGSMLAQVISKKESGELPGGAGDAPAAEATPEPEAAPEEPAAESPLEPEAEAASEEPAAPEAPEAEEQAAAAPEAQDAAQDAAQPEATPAEVETPEPASTPEPATTDEPEATGPSAGEERANENENEKEE